MGKGDRVKCASQPHSGELEKKPISPYQLEQMRQRAQLERLDQILEGDRVVWWRQASARN
jgi:hypothetical protein